MFKKYISLKLNGRQIRDIRISPMVLRRAFSKRRLIILFSAILAIAFLFHREPNKPFHQLGPECERLGASNPLGAESLPFPSECASIKQLRNASLAFVEFDDQGAYFDQRQSFAALRLVREALQSPDSAVEVFVFVHGWQHNANPLDEHVLQFSQFLVSRSPHCAAGCRTKKTIGIYLGWPGTTLKFPLNALTFWSRKAAAHRVAAGSIQEFFATLQQLKSDHESSVFAKKVDPTNFKTYVIGHSFGGLIAFQANSQSLALRYGQAVLDNRGLPQVTKVGDLLILINPAIEALRFKPLHSLWSEYPNDPFYSPAMVVVGSRTDLATKLLFPVGVAAGTLATNQIRSGQWSDALTTIGNADSYRTHSAYIDPGHEIVVCERPHPFSMRKAPFWFISANPNLIDGHGDLNAKNLISMFATINDLVESRTLGGVRSCKTNEE